MFATSALALTLAAAPAQAAEASDGPLTWSWQQGQSVEFISEMLLDSPTVIWFYAVNNAQARMFRVELRAHYKCTGQPARKGFEVECAVLDAALNGTAVTSDQDQVPEIMGEYAALLKKGTVQMSIREDGHIKLVDLEGVPKDLQRANEVHEILRQLVRRSLSPLGMQAPKAGADPGRTWRHKGPPAFFELMSKYGSSGGMIYEYDVQSQDGDVTVISAEGKATVATNSQREQGLPASLSLIGTGSYRFDTAAHTLAYGEVAVNGVTTASYSLPGQTQGFGFGARVMRVNADGSVEGPEGPVQ